MLLSGLCDTATPAAFSTVMSSGDTHTPCAASVRGPHRPTSLQVPRRRRVGQGQRRVDLGAGLGQVDEQRHLVLVGQGAARLQRRGLQRVERVRRHRRRDQRRGPSTAVMNRSVRASPSSGVLASGHRELDDRLAEDAAEAGLARGASDLLLEVVHVGEGGRARPDHLERGQPRAGPDERRRDRLGLGREDVLLQPVHQVEVAAQPAEQHHRRVPVGVDQPGQHDLAGAVDGLARLEGGGDGRRRVHADDVGAVDRHRARVPARAGSRRRSRPWRW